MNHRCESCWEGKPKHRILIVSFKVLDKFPSWGLTKPPTPTPCPTPGIFTESPTLLRGQEWRRGVSLKNFGVAAWACQRNLPFLHVLMMLIGDPHLSKSKLMVHQALFEFSECRQRLAFTPSSIAHTPTMSQRQQNPLLETLNLEHHRWLWLHTDSRSSCQHNPNNQ